MALTSKPTFKVKNFVQVLSCKHKLVLDFCMNQGKFNQRMTFFQLPVNTIRSTPAKFVNVIFRIGTTEN